MEQLQPGTYVVAVSGGVDSMALLGMLCEQPGLDIVVAHVNHGIRPDAAEDVALVRWYAAAHGLPFMETRLELGDHPSEAAARTARYNFLQQCSKKVGARGTVLAHHQDDLIETALLAIMRGTGWRGLAPFTAHSHFVRPLLRMPKHHLIAYARAHAIPWREDTTNTDESYTRNYIRHTLVPSLDQKSSTWRDAFLQHIRNQQERRTIIEAELNKWLDTHVQFNNKGNSAPATATLRRYDVLMLPQPVAYEILQQTMRRLTGNSLERPRAEAAVLFTKVAKPQKVLQLGLHWQLRSLAVTVIVEPRTPVLSLEKQ